jgi:hypothetical protein
MTSWKTSRYRSRWVSLPRKNHPAICFTSPDGSARYLRILSRWAACHVRVPVKVGQPAIYKYCQGWPACHVPVKGEVSLPCTSGGSACHVPVKGEVSLPCTSGGSACHVPVKGGQPAMYELVGQHAMYLSRGGGQPVRVGESAY